MKEINCIKNIDCGIKESSWERYKKSLLSNEDRIKLYTLWDKYDSTPESSSFDYHNKEQEEIVEWCMSNFRFKRGLLVTLHLPSYFTYGKFSEVSQRLNEKNPDDYFFQIEQVLTRFFRRLERKVYKGGNKRLEKFSVIEGCYNRNKRNHIHTVIEVPEHLSIKEFCRLIHKSHGSLIKSEGYTNYLIRDVVPEIEVVEDKNTISSKNGLWKSRNISWSNTSIVDDNMFIQSKKEVPVINRKSLVRYFELGNIHIQQLDHLSRQKLYFYLTKEVKKDRYTVSFKNTYEKSSKYLDREKRVKQERKNWTPFSKRRDKHIPITLEDFGVKVVGGIHTNNMITVDMGKESHGLNNLVSRKSSSVSRLERINEMVTSLDSPV